MSLLHPAIVRAKPEPSYQDERHVMKLRLVYVTTQDNFDLLFVVDDETTGHAYAFNTFKEAWAFRRQQPRCAICNQINPFGELCSACEGVERRWSL